MKWVSEVVSMALAAISAFVFDSLKERQNEVFRTERDRDQKRERREKSQGRWITISPKILFAPLFCYLRLVLRVGGVGGVTSDAVPGESVGLSGDSSTDQLLEDQRLSPSRGVLPALALPRAGYWRPVDDDCPLATAASASSRRRSAVIPG